MLSLWLDDVREMPPLFNKHVYTAQAAITAILEANGTIEKVSLDHDLGFENETGYLVACFIEERANLDLLEPFNCYVHTANSVAAPRMLAALENAARFWKKNKKITIKVERMDFSYY